MRISKLIVGIVILLFAQCSFINSAETSLVQEAIKLLAINGAHCNEEIDEHFLVLLDIQSDLNRISELNQIILNELNEPSSLITESENEQLEYLMNRLRELSTEASRDVSLLMLANAIDEN